MVRHQGKEVALTNREFQLLQFLLDHPHGYSTTSQILGQAWPIRPVSREVRNYVQRVRKILADLAIPVDLVNKPSHGYLDRGTPQGRKEDPGPSSEPKSVDRLANLGWRRH